jgi:hypothetical protein
MAFRLVKVHGTYHEAGVDGVLSGLASPALDCWVEVAESTVHVHHASAAGYVLKYVLLTVPQVLDDAGFFAICSSSRRMAKWNATVLQHCLRERCPTNLEFYFKEHKWKLFYMISAQLIHI